MFKNAYQIFWTFPIFFLNNLKDHCKLYLSYLKKKNLFPVSSATTKSLSFKDFIKFQCSIICVNRSVSNSFINVSPVQIENGGSINDRSNRDNQENTIISEHP